MTAKPTPKPLPDRFVVTVNVDGIGTRQHIVRAASSDAVMDRIRRAYPGSTIVLGKLERPRD